MSIPLLFLIFLFAMCSGIVVLMEFGRTAMFTDRGALVYDIAASGAVALFVIIAISIGA